MKLHVALVAYISIACALAAWAGVVFFALSIEEMSQKSADLALSAKAANEQQTTAFQTHEFAKNTAPARAQFEGALKSDPLSLSSMLSQVGKDAGIELQISGASPEGVPAAPLVRVSAIGFALQSNAPFATLVHVVKLLEVLPVPSRVESVDLNLVTDTARHTSLWHLNARVKVLTGAQI